MFGMPRARGLGRVPEAHSFQKKEYKARSPLQEAFLSFVGQWFGEVGAECGPRVSRRLCQTVQLEASDQRDAQECALSPRVVNSVLLEADARAQDRRY